VQRDRRGAVRRGRRGGGLRCAVLAAVEAQMGLLIVLLLLLLPLPLLPGRRAAIGTGCRPLPQVPARCLCGMRRARIRCKRTEADTTLQTISIIVWCS